MAEDKLIIKGTESTSWEPVDVQNDAYIAKVVKVEPKTILDKKLNQERKCIESIFEIADGEHSGKQLSYLCTVLISDKSKLGKFIKTATGEEKIEVGKDYDVVPLLLGKTFKIVTDMKLVVMDDKTVNSSFVKEVLSKVEPEQTSSGSSQLSLDKAFM